MSITPSQSVSARSGASQPVVARVILTVHDLASVGDFYQRVIGLSRMCGDGQTLILGSGTQALLELRRDSHARRNSSRDAGLFHTAFLLPDRAYLSAWLTHAARMGLHLDGASDHAVSEAVYLRDPEGNGIEIYADRPIDRWQWQDGLVTMTNDPLDVPDVLSEASGSNWIGIPNDTTIGHVHLQVGALDQAEAFYRGQLKLAVTCRYSGAMFYSHGRYHHHLATNVWNSRGAGPRMMPSTGLSEVQLSLPSVAPGLFQDPWGTAIRVLS